MSTYSSLIVSRLPFDILPLIDWEHLRSLPPKWILGYSDISTLTFTYTLNTGVASAPGTNYCDLSATRWDPLTRRWRDVLGTEVGKTVIQHASEKDQSSWDRTFKNLGTGFYLDHPLRNGRFSESGTPPPSLEGC